MWCGRRARRRRKPPARLPGIAWRRICAGTREGKPATEKMLERLTAAQPAPAAPVAAPQPVHTVNEGKLEALTHAQETAPSPAPSPAETPKQADLEKANEKLSSLLGKPK